MEYDTPVFYQLMAYASQADRDVVDMVSGSPDWEPPDAIREGLRSYADGEPEDFQYPPTAGLEELRHAIATRRGVDPNAVVVTAGAGEANYLAMAAALDRAVGEQVILVDPVYPYYPGKVAMLGGKATYVAAGPGGSVDPAIIERAAGGDTAAIVVNTPNNPTGAVYAAETMAALVEIAEEHDALLISDEVYDHFDFTGGFSSALGIDSAHRIVTNAFSKSMAITGFRVGYGVFPPAIVDAATTRHMLTTVAGSRPAQAAVLAALRRTTPDYYEGIRQLVADRIETFTGALDEVGAEYTVPDGGFYVLARFDGFPGSRANVERLIDEAGVAGMPGEVFGESCADWIRFALVTPRVEEAATRLGAFFG